LRVRSNKDGLSIRGSLQIHLTRRQPFLLASRARCHRLLLHHWTHVLGIGCEVHTFFWYRLPVVFASLCIHSSVVTSIKRFLSLFCLFFCHFLHHPFFLLLFFHDIKISIQLPYNVRSISMFDLVFCHGFFVHFLNFAYPQEVPRGCFEGVVGFDESSVFARTN